MTHKKNTAVQTGKKPNLMLIIVVAVMAIGAVWFWQSGKNQAPSSSTVEPSAELGSEDAPAQAPPALPDLLTKLGTAIAIGKSSVGMEIPGVKVLSEGSISGLTELLDGTDIEPVVAAMEAAKVGALLVDPSIATPSPLPQNTVRNRLALTRPSGPLNAKYMSRNLVVYVVERPPTLIADDKKALMGIVRASFAGQMDKLPADLPATITVPKEGTMILTVRPLQSAHTSYHALTDTSLAKNALALGLKARSYYQKRPDLLKAHGSLDEALAKALTLELEVAYDFGTFTGPRDNAWAWRIIDPGIYGLRMQNNGKENFQPPWYSVTTNLRELRSLFEKLVGQVGFKEKDAWLRSDVSFDRFRTIHFREKTPGGPLQDLYRAIPVVPSTASLTKESLVASLKGLGDWIADNQTKPNGQYVYRYFPTSDEEVNEYNMVRHCLGPFSMALTQEFINDPKYKEKADAGMRFIASHIRWGGPPRDQDGNIDTTATNWNGKPLPGPDVAILEFAEPPEDDWSVKMGAVAVSILGYTQYERVGWTLSPENKKVLEGLKKFLLYMQNEKEQNFYHYYVSPKSPLYNTLNSIYPGEILYAVGRLYGETKEEIYRTVFKTVFKTNLEWFKGEMAKKLDDGTYEEEQRKNLVQFQPWIAMAMDEMYRYDPDPAYVEASNLVSLWILDNFQYDDTRAFMPDYLGGYMKVYDELPAMHTFVYTEGTAASFDLARRAKVDAPTLDRLRKGAFLSARFILQMQIREGENDYYYPNPKKARGAVKYCMNHNKQRIDYTYHALSSVYRLLKAATPEDYAAVQAIPMPKAW